MIEIIIVYIIVATAVAIALKKGNDAMRHREASCDGCDNSCRWR